MGTEVKLWWIELGAYFYGLFDLFILCPFVPLGTRGICKAPPSDSVLRQSFNLAPCHTTFCRVLYKLFSKFASVFLISLTPDPSQELSMGS
jgi:hypothetical protein